MTEAEKHEYHGFDRFLQVVNTKYEEKFYKLEEKYMKKEITLDEYNKLFGEIIEKIKKENTQK